MEPIHSRCTCIDFKLNGSKATMASRFFKRVESILTLENVKYDKEVVAAIISKHFPDNRRVLNELQRFSISGVIDKGALGAVADVQLKDLIKSLKEKDFASARKWVTQNLDNDPTKIYRKIYDGLYELLKPNSVPQLVLHLAKYQYQSAFVADHEINMIACMTEIMVDCEFK
jgi:DNA polymerase III delta prime subunit